MSREKRGRILISICRYLVECLIIEVMWIGSIVILSVLLKENVLRWVFMPMLLVWMFVFNRLKTRITNKKNEKIAEKTNDQFSEATEKEAEIVTENKTEAENKKQKEEKSFDVKETADDDADDDNADDEDEEDDDEDDYAKEIKKSNVKFSDVAGIDEEKEQLEEIVNFLKYPQRYTANGAKIPKGILLDGEPGTGKTLLAKAIAGEAGVPFFQTTGSSFEEELVGVGASRVRKLFRKAKKESPCIIFIDEIDFLARSRYKGKSDSEQTLNQLLAEMDGFDSDDNVIVIAATNHIEILDPALIRSGRFDRHISVPMPDILAREKILQVHAKNKKFEEDISLKEIAKKTVGFSGADLKNLLNEAVIYSVNHGSNGIITKEAIDESIARILLGLQKRNSAITEEERRLLAVHESGHAIISAIVRPEVKNLGISIIPRGTAGGYNFFGSTDRIYQRKTELFKQMQVSYGGRIAEDVIFDDISSGAETDLEEATEIAYQMTMKFAMNETLITKIHGEDDFNTHLDSVKIDKVEKLCQQAYNSAYAIIQENKKQLLGLADLLIEKEYLSQEEVEKFLKETYS